ncbi:MAG: alpha/beta hydrolase [Planctomycetota bacterium]
MKFLASSLLTATVILCEVPAIAQQVFRKPTATSPQLAKVPPSIEVRSDVVFGKGGGRDLKMHVLLPSSNEASKAPVYVWIHGGGWRSGNKESGIQKVLPLVHAGFIGVTLEYRLTGEAAFPAQIHDCKCAIRFLRAHAEDWGIDPDRIAVGGASAGGHLAALVGTSSGVDALEGEGGWPEQSSRVQAVVDLYGPTDFARFVTTEGYEHHNADGSPESRLLGGGVVSENAEGIRRVNPITYVDPQDPPFLILHGSDDPVVPLNQSQALHEALQRNGVSSSLHVLPGALHGGPEFGTKPIQAMQRDFLVETLGEQE